MWYFLVGFVAGVYVERHYPSHCKNVEQFMCGKIQKYLEKMSKKTSADQ